MSIQRDVSSAQSASYAWLTKTRRNSLLSESDRRGFSPGFCICDWQEVAAELRFTPFAAKKAISLTDREVILLQLRRRHAACLGRDCFRRRQNLNALLRQAHCAPPGTPTAAARSPRSPRCPPARAISLSLSLFPLSLSLAHTAHQRRAKNTHQRWAHNAHQR